MSKVTSKDAMAALARVQREHAKVLEDAAGVLRSQADVLTLLAGEIAVAQEGGEPTAAATPAAEAPKRGRPRKEEAAAPVAEAPAAQKPVTFDEVKGAMKSLYEKTGLKVPGPDMLEAVFARNGIKKISEAKPEHYAKLFADLQLALVGQDFTASSEAPKPPSMFD